MTPLAHVAGIPVEEIVLGLAPMSAVIAAAVASLRSRRRGLRRAAPPPRSPPR